MTRRLISLIAATTLVFALMPALAASASAAGSASLVGDRDVFPGAKTFQVQVTNDEATLLGLTGSRINAVRIFLPRHVGVTTAAGEATGPNDNWTSVRQDSGNLQVWNFSTTANGIAPGGSTGTFTFPADVLPPSNGDRDADFQVAVSSDGGQTFNTVGGSNLRAVIRVLEVDNMVPWAPAGIKDGSGTSGQDITYALGVRNHAQQSLPVTVSISSSNGDASSPVTRTIAAGSRQGIAVPVKLHETSSDRTSTFRSTATAPDAVAPERTRDFLVQAAPRIELDRSTFRDTIQDKSARYVNSRQTYQFEIRGTKFNTPGLNITGGRFEVADSVFELDSGLAFEGNGTREFLLFEAGKILGPDGDHDGEFFLTGIDANDAPFTQAMPIRLSDLLTIDNLLPEIDVRLQLPSGQGSVRQGQSVTVSGEVINKPNAPANYFDVDFVEVIVPGIGMKEVSVTTSNGGRAFSGSTTLDAETFPVPVRDNPLNMDHPTEPNSALPFVEDIYAVAQVTDLASNSGGGASDDETFNPYHPRLVNPARTRLDDKYGTKPVIEVEVFELTALSGGCNPLLWRVDGETTVKQVLLSDGSPCSAGTTDDGVRILKLLQSIDPFATPSVEYVPSDLPTMDRLVDTANHFTPRTVIDTVTGIVPRVPLIERVTRTNADGERETAYFDSEEENYWTARGGNDAQVTISRAEAGQILQVTDCAGNVLNSTTAGGPEETIALALGNVGAGTEVAFERCLRLRNSAGPSAERPLEIVVNTINPFIDSAVRSGNEVTVTFNEPVVAGTNFSSSWQAFEVVENQDGSSGTDEFYYPVERVSGERSVRTLEVSFGDRGDFGGTIYEFLAMNADARRYEDRAGNRFADQTWRDPAAV